MSEDKQTPETIAIDEFAKLELRVGEVIACERHPDAEKLLVAKVALGEDDTRQIVAGLAETHAPEELVGRRVVVVANLKPTKLRGVRSEGMLLAASPEGDGKPALLTTDGEIRSGAKVR